MNRNVEYQEFNLDANNLTQKLKMFKLSLVAMKYPLTHVHCKIYENGISRTALCRSENVRPLMARH
jgi:hypothetical protein